MPPEPPAPWKKTNMTILIGIICNDGIVVAADGQTTWDTGKSWATNKLTDLKHQHGHAIVAEAGAVFITSNIIDELERLTCDKSLSDKHRLPELLQMASRKAWNDLRQNQGDCTGEELQRIIDYRDLHSKLLCAHYEGENPILTTLVFGMGACNRAKDRFEAIGSGSDLASYLLTGLMQAKQQLDLQAAALDGEPVHNYEINTDEGLAVAAYVVEAVKQHDPYCGGPTRLGIVRHPKVIAEGESLTITNPDGSILMDDSLPVFIVSQQETERIVAAVAKIDTTTKSEFWIQVLGSITKASRNMTHLLNRAASALKEQRRKTSRKKTK